MTFAIWRWTERSIQTALKIDSVIMYSLATFSGFCPASLYLGTSTHEPIKLAPNTLPQEKLSLFLSWIAAKLLHLWNSCIELSLFLSGKDYKHGFRGGFLLELRYPGQKTACYKEFSRNGLISKNEHNREKNLKKW